MSEEKPAIKIKMPIQMKYHPQEDITAYEIALLLPFFTRSMYEDDWERLEKVGATRHLKKKEEL